MAVEPVRFRNRHTGRIETEAIYGEAWLRWAYGTPAGRWALRLVATRPWFSRWYGWRMSRPASRHRVRPFIETYGLDPAEFADPPDAFPTFNAFFSRRLRPGARPVDPDPRVVVFPADGRHLGLSNLTAAEVFYVKGQRFDLPAFLRDPDLTRRFAGGPAILSRLCPVDYHRVHFPVAGVPSAPRVVGDRLWSVNPVALRRRLACLWENRRWLSLIDTPSFGGVLMVEIGATNVGSTRHTFRPGHPVAKGEEKGYFEFGGSAVLTLFEPGRVRLSDDLAAAGAEGLELYAHMGEPAARGLAASAGPGR